MKFKNVGETTRVRLPEGDGFRWITVQKDAEVDLPEKIGLAHSFEKVEEKPVKKEKSTKQSKKK